MKSISGFGLGLCVVFGCLLLALIAELYYLLCWKKKKKIIIATNINDEEQNGIQIPHKTSKFSHIFHICKTRSSSLTTTPQELCNSPIDLVNEPQSSSSSNKDLWLKRPFAEEKMENYPRFLFTITEETKEDLESEDAIFKNTKHSKSRSNLSVDTPFMTPLASPPYFTPPLTPLFCDQQSFEWARDEEFNSVKASPPSIFKFLRDAEEKLVQRRMMVVENHQHHENKKFITLVVNEKQDEICSGNLEENEECFSSKSSHR